MKNQLGQQVRRVAVTDPIAAARPFDYADAYELRLPKPDRDSPETWVRAGLDTTPALADRIVGLLGLRETPTPSPDRLSVFRIVESGPEMVHLEASTPLMDIVAVGRTVERTRRTMTTVLRYKRPLLARLVWAFVGIVHRRLTPWVLRGKVAID